MLTEDVRVIHDATTWALEHNCWSANNSKVSMQAGIAIYPYNKYGKLLFVHVVDDFHDDTI